MVVDQVENQVYVSVYGLVLSQLRLHSVQPVDQSLQSVCELTREQQSLLQLVLPAGQKNSFIFLASLDLLCIYFASNFLPTSVIKK